MDKGSDNTGDDRYDDPKYLSSKDLTQTDNVVGHQNPIVGHQNPTFQRGPYDDDTSSYDTLDINTSSNHDGRPDAGRTSEMGNKNLGYLDGNRSESRNSLSPYAIDTPTQNSTFGPKPTAGYSDVHKLGGGVEPPKPPRIRPHSDVNDTKRPGIGPPRPTSDTTRPSIGPPFTVSDTGRPGIGAPSPIIDAKRPTPDKKARESTYSDYSVISDVMPPRVGEEPRSSMYDEIPMSRTSTAASTQSRPSSVLTQRKGNQLYETTVSTRDLAQKPKEPSHEIRTKDDSSSDGYCKCVFLMFICLVAVGALVLVFLVMFGVVKIQGCQECGDDYTNPSTGASTGSSQSSSELKNLALQVAYIKGNLSVVAQNADNNVTSLQQQIEDQKKIIKELREELVLNKQLVEMLNISVHNFSLRQGERGPRGHNGYNGTQGPPGPAGPAAIFDSSLCTFRTETSSGTEKVKAFSQNHAGEYTTNLSCSFENVDADEIDSPILGVSLKPIVRANGDKDYFCECMSAENVEIECRIHYWHCPSS